MTADSATKHIFAIEGVNAEKKFYYQVSVVRSALDEFSVTQASVVSTSPR